MKLKCRFEMIDMGDELICVPVGEKSKEVQGVLKLNREGQEILEMLKNDISETGIVNALTAKYDNSVDNISFYVHRVIEELKANSLLDE
ncbi:MAG: hypothetical protein IKN04_03890 [Clostridia bacterium]|nr:hypothetical protein [Clostridia bacterium]